MFEFDFKLITYFYLLFLSLKTYSELYPKKNEKATETVLLLDPPIEMQLLVISFKLVFDYGWADNVR